MNNDLLRYLCRLFYHVNDYPASLIRETNWHWPYYQPRKYKESVFKFTYPAVTIICAGCSAMQVKWYYLLAPPTDMKRKSFNTGLPSTINCCLGNGLSLLPQAYQVRGDISKPTLTKERLFFSFVFFLIWEEQLQSRFLTVLPLLIFSAWKLVTWRY